VVRSELSDPSVSYWLRSIPRKPWALAIPYLGDSGQFKTLYPDFIFVRKVGDGKYVTDIVDPHNPALGDSAAKLRGLADYAGLHGGSFGRIEAAIMAGESLIRIDLKNEDICAEALKVVTSADVEALFHARGTSRRGNA
jgi:type III restriction enzyme